jgi:hypothetical protein
MSEYDYEGDMASMCDWINTHCRELGVEEANNYKLSLMRDAIDRLVFKQKWVAHNLRAEIERLRAALRNNFKNCALAEANLAECRRLLREGCEGGCDDYGQVILSKAWYEAAAAAGDGG